MKLKVDRLLKLADFLDTIPRKAFHLETWVYSDQDKPEGKRPGDCGFAGCAVGWAAHAGIVPGLKLDRTKRRPVYKGEESWEAVAKAFGLDSKWGVSDDAYHLFSRDRYIARDRTAPKTVAKRIRQFVAEHTAKKGA